MTYLFEETGYQELDLEEAEVIEVPQEEEYNRKLSWL